MKILDMTSRQILKGDLCLLDNSFAKLSHIESIEKTSKRYYDKGDRFITQHIKFLRFGRVSVETLKEEGELCTGLTRELCIELGQKSKNDPSAYRRNIYDPESDFQMSNALLLSPGEFLYERFIYLQKNTLQAQSN